MLTQLRIWWLLKRERYEAVIECEQCNRNELMSKALIVHEEGISTIPPGNWAAFCRRCS